MKDKIIYVYDALCGWCYGFSPVMQKLYETYHHEIDFDVISGGMITGERVGPISEVAPFITNAYKDVERVSGIKFGEAFLEGILAKGTAILTSEKPAYALAVFKTYHRDKAVPFSSTLQKAIYYDGIEPNDDHAYGKYTAEYGIDAAEFVAKMQDKQYMQMAQAEFEQTAMMGIRGFPAVIYGKHSHMYLIARGYTTFDEINAVIKQVQEDAV
jgi:putative protein-disulfide isomerase